MKFYKERSEGDIGARTRIVVKDDMGAVVVVRDVPEEFKDNQEYISALSVLIEIELKASKKPAEKTGLTEIII